MNARDARTDCNGRAQRGIHWPSTQKPHVFTEGCLRLREQPDSRVAIAWRTYLSLLRLRRTACPSIREIRPTSMRSKQSSSWFTSSAPALVRRKPCEQSCSGRRPHDSCGADRNRGHRNHSRVIWLHASMPGSALHNPSKSIRLDPHAYSKRRICVQALLTHAPHTGGDAERSRMRGMPENGR